MNKDLFTYLERLPQQLSQKIWLRALSQMAKNGNSNIIFRDLLLEYHISKTQLKEYFNPGALAKLNLVKIITQTDTFICINFHNKRTELKLLVREKKAIEPKEKEIKITKQVKEISLVIKNEFGLQVGPFTKQYKASPTLMKEVMADYSRFYMGIIANKAALLGNAIVPVPPKYNDLDFKYLRQLCYHFSQYPLCKSESQIASMFRFIYSNWHLLPDNYQGYHSIPQINRNINGIMLEVQTINPNTNKKHTKKDEQFNSKINETESHDYSEMVHKR